MGWERGTPIDRYYIERFLRKHCADVHGHVLEVKEDRYSTQLGAKSVDVVDIDETNALATIVGDLCDAGTLPVGTFDAAVVTQTLQFVADPRRAAGNILRSLRPGGILLLTVPCMSRVGGSGDRGRWMAAGGKEVFGDLAPMVDIETESNVAGVSSLPHGSRHRGALRQGVGCAGSRVSVDRHGSPRRWVLMAHAPPSLRWIVRRVRRTARRKLRGRRTVVKA